MGIKDSCKSLSNLVNANKLVFAWGESSTSRSNIVKTPDLRIDVHKDFNYTGYAIAKIQVNKGAKDPGAKEFLKKGNKGSHKTTHKNVAEIRYSQMDLNEAEFKRQVADPWKAASVEAPMGSDEIMGKSSTSGLTTGESSGSGYATTGGSHWSYGSGGVEGEPVWEWDTQMQSNRYYDGIKYVYWGEESKREKDYDGFAWQWKN